MHGLSIIIRSPHFVPFPLPPSLDSSVLHFLIYLTDILHSFFLTLRWVHSQLFLTANEATDKLVRWDSLLKPASHLSYSITSLSDWRGSITYFQFLIKHLFFLVTPVAPSLSFFQLTQPLFTISNPKKGFK